LLGEAVVAVDGPVQPWFEGDLAGSTAAAAHGVVHDALAAAAAAPVAAAAAAALGAPGLTAGGTAFGFLIPSGSVEFLIGCRKGELSAAIDAN
jgi:hypothetical protein